MKKFIYAFKDKELNCFGMPRFEEIPPESYKEGFRRGLLKGFKPDQLGVFIGQELHCLGTYDDSTGEVVQDKSYKLLDCDEVLKERKDLDVKEGA